MAPVGTVLIHPSHGTAKVARTEQRDIGQGPTEYVVLEMLMGGLTLKVPAATLAETGVREPMSKADAQRAMGELAVPLATKGNGGNGKWAAQFKANTIKSQSGDPFELVEVVRAIATKASPSPAEKRLLARCTDLLVGEIAAATGDDVEQVAAKVAAAAESCGAAAAG